MSLVFPIRRRWAAALLAAALGAGCDGPPQDPTEQEVQQRLVGTWLREYAEGGFNVRRVLVLGPDGRFREASRITEHAVPQAEHTHAGEWLFDGTNLKRRYTSVDGRQPSAPAMPFATFELKFPSRNEFVGIDRVHKVQVEYRRVADGTLP